MVLTFLKLPTEETFFFVCLSWDKIQTVCLFKQCSSFRMLQDYVDKAPRILKIPILSNVNKRIILGICSFETQGMMVVMWSVFLPYAEFYQPDCCKHSRWKAEVNHWVPGSVQCSKLRRVRKPPGSFQSNNDEQRTNTIARNMYVVKLSLHRSETALLCRCFFPSRGSTFTHCSNHFNNILITYVALKIKQNNFAR